MRKMILTIALAVLLLQTLAHESRAQDESGKFDMPCVQVLRLGLDKFVDAYGEKTGDYSTAGQKQGFDYYMKCKRPANDALAAKILSQESRARTEAVREAYNKFGSSLWDLKYFEEGGGTMWGLISVGAFAAREDFLERFIRSLGAPDRKSARSRRSANASILRIRRLLSSGDRKPFMEWVEPERASETMRQYRESLKEAREALSRLQSLLRSLPDGVAERLASEMRKETVNALAEEH